MISDEPARDCFTGIASPSTLEVTLGAPSSSGSSTYPSCQGVDGLQAGSVLTIGISLAPRTQVLDSTCVYYMTESFQGASDVTLTSQAEGIVTTPYDLTSIYGAFSSPTVQGCGGSWEFALRPGTFPPDGQLVSPLDASASQPWILERSIAITQGQSCGAVFETDEAVTCRDSFPVASITEVAP